MTRRPPAWTSHRRGASLRRPVLAALAAAAALTLTACASLGPERRADTPPGPASHTQVTVGALAGSWRAGQEHLLLTMDGVYTWERVLSCDVPPCPVHQTSGTFELRDRAIALATVKGPELVLDVELASDPRRLTVHSESLAASWTLRYEN